MHSFVNFLPFIHLSGFVVILNENRTDRHIGRIGDSVSYKYEMGFSKKRGGGGPGGGRFSRQGTYCSAQKRQ